MQKNHFGDQLIKPSSSAYANGSFHWIFRWRATQITLSGHQGKLTRDRPACRVGAPPGEHAFASPSIKESGFLPNFYNPFGNHLLDRYRKNIGHQQKKPCVSTALSLLIGRNELRDKHIT
jgi:hypothetical protein